MSGMTAVTPIAQLNSPNSGKQARSTSPGCMSVEIADLLDLGVEIPMAIEHALGRAGAAGGEDDGRRILGRGGRPTRLLTHFSDRASCSSVGPPQNQRRPTVTFNRARGNRRRQKRADGLDHRDGHETFGLGLGQAADQVAPAHAGIDQNRYGAGLEHGEHQGDEIDPRPNQQGQPRARGTPIREVPGQCGRSAGRVGGS